MCPVLYVKHNGKCVYNGLIHEGENRLKEGKFALWPYFLPSIDLIIFIFALRRFVL